VSRGRNDGGLKKGGPRGYLSIFERGPHGQNCRHHNSTKHQVPAPVGVAVEKIDVHAEETLHTIHRQDRMKRSRTNCVRTEVYINGKNTNVIQLSLFILAAILVERWASCMDTRLNSRPIISLV
jgi:hypothetical protein